MMVAVCIGACRLSVNVMPNDPPGFLLTSTSRNGRHPFFSKSVVNEILLLMKLACSNS